MHPRLLLIATLVGCGSSDASLEAVEEALVGELPEGPGALPLPFPVVEEALQPGQQVLAPTEAAVQALRQRGEGPLVFYGQTVREVEGPEVVVSGPSGWSRVPAMVVVPLEDELEVTEGDWVLGSHPHAAGWQRARVVKGGRSPTVRLVDHGGRQSSWSPGSFRRLDGEHGPGATVVCGERGVHGMVVRRHDDDLLVVGFAGRLRVEPAEACRPVAPAEALEVGDRVSVPRLGRMVEGEVAATDPDSGRVQVTTEFAGRASTHGYAWLDVVPAD